VVALVFIAFGLTRQIQKFGRVFVSRGGEKWWATFFYLSFLFFAFWGDFLF
jgi:hypothetical protein